MPKKGQIYKNYTMEVKIRAVELKKEGRSYSQIANELNINTSTVKTWWSRYQENGNTFFLDKRGHKNQTSDQEKYIRKLELENAVLKKLEEILIKEGRK
ncbi:helix-turn-helix domain-containing protein [Mesobacillus subterraneus]|uniref:helix-turn-helix domain-containing protein n=2 Tax=Mesobacillus subterraneus TaxID=285983 RepID=UPI00204260A8|nr:helix-turn-helix domain-containing protein [Mesobacillus subterraneus]MCM3686363.1 helix-turn-helix domain-containing protein [Mesobacillus subterraneus]